MLEHILYHVPERWQDLVELLASPLSWIAQMQQDVREFLFGSSGTIVFLKSVMLLFPALLWLTAVWYRMRFVSTMLMAWWEAARMAWWYWVGLTRLVMQAGTDLLSNFGVGGVDRANRDDQFFDLSLVQQALLMDLDPDFLADFVVGM